MGEEANAGEASGMKPNTILYYDSGGENEVEMAKQYCYDNGLTPKDVKIVKKEDAVMVVAKGVSRGR